MRKMAWYNENGFEISRSVLGLWGVNWIFRTLPSEMDEINKSWLWFRDSSWDLPCPIRDLDVSAHSRPNRSSWTFCLNSRGDSRTKTFSGIFSDSEMARTICYDYEKKIMITPTHGTILRFWLSWRNHVFTMKSIGNLTLTIETLPLWGDLFPSPWVEDHLFGSQIIWDFLVLSVEFDQHLFLWFQLEAFGFVAFILRMSTIK